jgi:hypothetical protein
MKRFRLACLILLIVSSCAPLTVCGNSIGTDNCTHILFIGNSYTSVNDLPATFTKLADSGGHRVDAQMIAPGGQTLAQHAASVDTLDKLNSSKWDYVVLQEQSQISASPSIRNDQMYPAARTLVKKIRDAGATPVLFSTWAHKDGWPENGLNSEGMQYEINVAYLGIAQELNVPVSPVGEAWFTTSRQHPEIVLWQADGSHPTEEGTYLAAAVFYAVIFRASPEGLNYTSSLSKETAQILQAIAAKTVLTNPLQWHLP